jgi:hypothetical protein
VNAAVAPSVLVVADQEALVGGGVVFRLPDKPKNSATLPSGPWFAEQCMGMTPSAATDG